MVSLEKETTYVSFFIYLFIFFSKDKMANVQRNSWSIRVTSEDCRSLEKLQMLAIMVPSNKMLACIETGDETEKLHMHLLMYTVSAYTHNQMLTVVKKVYGVSGSSISCKDPAKGTGSEQKAIAYLCKGTHDGATPEILINRGFDIDIKAEHTKYWAVYNAVKGQRQDPKGKKLSTTDVLMALTAGKHDQDEILELCWEWYDAQPGHVQYNSFQDAVRKVCFRGSAEARREMKARMVRNIFS